MIAKVRNAFDLASDPAAIEQHLSATPMLADLIGQRPGLRLPASWDGFEGVVRAVLGQQITVKAAIGLGNRLVSELGRPLPSEVKVDGPITHSFPAPADLAQADLSFMPMPKFRQRTLKAVATAFVENPEILSGRISDVRSRLACIPGIGPWTLDYIALRVLRDPDSMPSTDVAIVRALAALKEQPCTSDDVAHECEAWAPWRSYAAQHLWASL